jgi:uncharacterized iron-regulated membrane protein
MSFKKIILKIHFYLGITCGLIASFSGLTGSLYVWQPEITAILNPKLLKVENIQNIKETTILTSVASLTEIHKDSLSRIFLPYREQQTISILFKNGKTNYYHPVTKKILGEKSASISFFENLLNLHRTLGIPHIGKYIMGTSTILFFLFLLTSGAYIWWKAYANNLQEGFKLKWKHNKRKFNFNLHKAFGIYFLVPLLIVAFTGSYFTYYSYYKSALKVIDDNNTTSVNQQNNTLENPTTFNKVLLNEGETYALIAIYFPLEKAGNYRFRYIKDRFIKAGFRKTKELEMSGSGKVILLSDFRYDSNSDRVAAQFYPFHIGEIAGLIGRILVFVSGIIPLVLLISGFRIFLFKKRNKRRGIKVDYESKP